MGDGLSIVLEESSSLSSFLAGNGLGVVLGVIGSLEFFRIWETVYDCIRGSGIALFYLGWSGICTGRR
jgi:hypothetical protein